MSKQYPQIKNKWGNKSHRKAPGERSIFAIRVGLLRINKGVVIENENGYHFQMGILSHHSQVFLTTRTQSTTIPIFARHRRLYIYKKWKCVEMLTVTRWHVDKSKRSRHDRYINHTASLLNITYYQSSRGGRKFTLIRIARCNGWAG